MLTYKKIYKKNRLVSVCLRVHASHFVCCSSVRAKIAERPAICQNGRLLIRVTAQGLASPAWQQLGSPFRSASGLPQSLNEKESGLVANHWCRKQINPDGLYFPNIVFNTGIKSSDGHQGAKRSRGWNSGRVEAERKVSAVPAMFFLFFCDVVPCNNAWTLIEEKKDACWRKVWAVSKCSGTVRLSTFTLQKQTPCTTAT